MYKSIIVNMDIGRRFLLFLQEKGLTQKEFEEKTGYPQNNLSRFITGAVKSPKLEIAVILMKYYPELNLRWLLLGEGQMFMSKNKTPNNIEQEYWKLLKENSELKSKLITFLEQPTEV